MNMRLGSDDSSWCFECICRPPIFVPWGFGSWRLRKPATRWGNASMDLQYYMWDTPSMSESAPHLWVSHAVCVIPTFGMLWPLQNRKSLTGSIDPPCSWEWSVVPSQQCSPLLRWAIAVDLLHSLRLSEVGWGLNTAIRSAKKPRVLGCYRCSPFKYMVCWEKGQYTKWNDATWDDMRSGDLTHTCTVHVYLFIYIYTHTITHIYIDIQIHIYLHLKYKRTYRGALCPVMSMCTLFMLSLSRSISPDLCIYM